MDLSDHRLGKVWVLLLIVATALELLVVVYHQVAAQGTATPEATSTAAPTGTPTPTETGTAAAAAGRSYAQQVSALEEAPSGNSSEEVQTMSHVIAYSHVTTANVPADIWDEAWFALTS